MPHVRHALVAGAGIGGLAFAVAARRHGLDVTVLERAPAVTGSGSGVVLAPNGMTALDALGDDVGGDVRGAGRVAAPDHRSPFLSSTGRLLAAVSLGDTQRAFGAPTVTILRADLHRVLLDHAHRAGATIEYGGTVESVRDDGGVVTARLADGREVRGDVLVGADGLRSVTRRHVVDDGEPPYRGISAVRGVGPAPAVHPDGFIAYGRGLILFASAISDHEVYWVASVRSAPGVWPAKSPEDARVDLLGAMRGWDPDLRQVVAGSGLTDQLVTDVHDRDPGTVWHRGRVVLLGDAVHPMVYTMGQGANTALEDAVVLAHHLTVAPSVDEAFRRYTADRAPRTAKIVEQSRMLASIGHVRNPLGAWLRDRTMRFAAAGDPEKANAALFGWRPPLRQSV